MTAIDWCTTGRNPKIKESGVDQGVRGWRLHAVPDGSDRALCGLKARYGWAYDLFIVAKCLSCTRKASQ